AQAFIYTRIVPVESTTLISMIAAACLGAWLGVGVIVRWPKRKIQIGMGVALLIAAVVFVSQAFQLLPPGGTTLGLRGTRLAIGLAGNFVLGVLMMLGIGLYAPCMIRQPARHESGGGVPDHDGVVRILDAGEQRSLRPHEDVPPSGDVGARARRRSRRPARRVRVRLVVDDRRSLARHRRRQLHVDQYVDDRSRCVNLSF